MFTIIAILSIAYSIYVHQQAKKDRPKRKQYYIIDWDKGIYFAPYVKVNFPKH